VTILDGQVCAACLPEPGEVQTAYPTAFAPDAPRPGRSHRTHQPRRPRTAPEVDQAGRWKQRRLPPLIPDTNAIEALNRQLRKAIKTKGSFPTEDAARKLIYLAIQDAVPQWTHTRGWTKALLAFKI
jgi:Transposase, Mutator family